MNTEQNTNAGLPSILSPSRAKDFTNCPQAFYYKSVLRLPTKQKEATTRGTIAHDALENLFKLPAGQRTEEAALNNIKPAWEKLQEKPVYQELAATLTLKQQEQMLHYAQEMVKNYFKLEDPNSIHPTGVEQRVKQNISEDLTMQGLIDRLSKPFIPALGKEAYIIDDYKTGKIPSVNWLEGNFFAMRVYALLLTLETGEMPFMLRLIYLKGNTQEEAVKRLLVTEQMLEDTRQELLDIWARIKEAHTTGVWETKTGPLCNFCDFKETHCPAFK